MRVRDIVPGAVVTRKATGTTRTIIRVDNNCTVVYRDDVRQGECSMKSLRSWINQPTKAERNARRKAHEQTS